MSILSNLNKILIIRLSSIGDVVLSSHLPRLIRNNKNLNPNLQLDFLTNNSIASLFKYNSYYSNILKFDGKNVKMLNTHILNQDYDTIIDLQKNKLSRKIINGYEGDLREVNKFRQQKLEMVYLKKFPKNAVHVAERYIDTCRDLIVDDELGLELQIPAPKNATFPRKKIVGVAPEAFHKTKRWQADKYKELIELLIADGYAVNIFGSNKNTLLGATPLATNYSGSLSLLQTAEKIAQCDYFVSNDTGLMHIAAAFHVPTLLIFGSSVRQLGFTPYKNHHIIVEKDLWCRPCSHIGRAFCPLGHFKCMSDISVAQVLDKFASLTALAV